MIIEKEINESKDIIHYKNILKFDMNWDEYIKILNEKFNSKKESNQKFSADSERLNDSRYVRKYKSEPIEIIVYNKLDPLIQNLKTETDIDSIKIIKSFLKDNNIKNYALKCIANFVGKENDYYVHYDNNDVLSFHLMGTAEYRIYKNVPENDLHKAELPYEFDSYLLEPGDVFFIPKKVCHQVVVSEPRITIIADYFQELQ